MAEPPGVVPPSTLQMSLGLTVGSVALLMLGLQPLAARRAGRAGPLTVDQLGLSATAELLTLGLTTGLLASLLKPARMRADQRGGLPALAAGQRAQHADQRLRLCRLARPGRHRVGFLVWIAVVMITRARAPDRVAGVFLTVQTLAQAALAAVLPLTAMVRWGANGGLAALACWRSRQHPASLLLQDRFSPLPKPAETKAGLPWARASQAWPRCFSILAGIVGLWVFVERLGHECRRAPARWSRHCGRGGTGGAGHRQFIGDVPVGSILPTMPVLAALCAIGNIAVVWLLGAPIGPGALHGRRHGFRLSVAVRHAVPDQAADPSWIPAGARRCCCPRRSCWAAPRGP